MKTLDKIADGCFSKVRQLAGFELIKTSPPMDILWFRLPRNSEDSKNNEGVMGRAGNGHLLAMINRLDYWQLGYVIPKGGYQKIRETGIEELRKSIVQLAPEFIFRVENLKEGK